MNNSFKKFVFGSLSIIKLLAMAIAPTNPWVALILLILTMLVHLIDMHLTGGWRWHRLIKKVTETALKIVFSVPDL